MGWVTRRYGEVSGAPVEDHTRWGADRRLRCVGNRDRQWHFGSCSVVKRGNSGAVIGNPPRAGSAPRDAPGIFQIWVGRVGSL